MDKKIEEPILVRLKEIAALFLWNDGAIKVNFKKPFRLVSGNFSPIYINCRIAISNPILMQFFLASARTIIAQNNLIHTLVAGGETAGIPFAAYIAQNLSLPMIYIRKKEKTHGIASKIEGVIKRNDKVLLVEDLITDARSKLEFIEAIKNAGGLVEDILVLFDREQGGREILIKQGIRLHTITDISTTLMIGKTTKLLSEAALESVQNYLKDPENWHREQGLPFKKEKK